jgi:rhodanese-related sulfurtransferase
LPGAVVIAPDDLEKRYEELSREREVIAYCGCPNDEGSLWAAQFLRQHGYKEPHCTPCSGITLYFSIVYLYDTPCFRSAKESDAGL